MSTSVSFDLTKLSTIQDCISVVRQHVDDIERKHELDIETMTKLLKEYSLSLNALSTKHISEDAMVRELQNSRVRLTGKLEEAELINKSI